MTEVLLEELGDRDIQWLQEVGHSQLVPANNILIQQNQEVNYLYIIIRGNLVATIAQNRGNLGSAFALLEDQTDLEQEIARFADGEVVGEICFLESKPASNTLKALEETLVLAIPRQELQDKLRRDLQFSSRFYRAIAILLLDRFQRLVKIYLRRPRGQIAPLQDIPLIFGELSDSDIDWLVEQGFTEFIEAGNTIINAGRQVENLYILIQGKMSVAISESPQNRLTSVFSALEASSSSNFATETPVREIAQISRGEIIGEVVTLDMKLSPATYRTLEDSLLLVIPRQRLLVKLQQDLAMSSRFYRVTAMLLADRLEGLISRLGFGKSTYTVGNRLSLDINYEDEIDMEIMDNLSLGGARFEWMLTRLKLKGV